MNAVMKQDITELKTILVELTSLSSQALSGASNNDIDVYENSPYFNNCIECLDTASAISNKLQATGLSLIIANLKENINQAKASENIPYAEIWEIITQFISTLQHYCAQPSDNETIENILSYISHPIWDKQFALEALDNLKADIIKSNDKNILVSDIANEEHISVSNEVNIADISEDQISEDPFMNTEIENTSSKEPVNTSSSIEPGQQELIDMFKAELHDLIDISSETLSSLKANSTDFQAWENFLAGQSLQAENIGKAANMVGLDGLETFCQIIIDNIAIFKNRETAYSENEMMLIEKWPNQIADYLEDISSSEKTAAIVRFLESPAWPKPYDSQNSKELNEALKSAEINNLNEDIEPRKTKALPEDVLLEITDDINRELLESVLQELPSQTLAFSESIFKLLQDNDVSQLDKARRAAHTLKGVGNLVGVAGIANLTHHLEDILEALNKSQTIPSKELKETLFKASDCIEIMSEHIAGEGESPDNAIGIFQEILDWANLLDNSHLAQNPQLVSTQVSIDSEKTNNDHDTEISNPANPAKNSESSPSLTDSLRISIALSEELLRISSESLINASQTQEKIRQLTESLKAVYAQNNVIEKVATDLDHLISIKGFMKPLKRSVNDDEFDPLEFDQYNELHTLTHQLQEACIDSKEMIKNTDVKLSFLEEQSLNQINLNRENHEIALRTQMIEVETIIPRLKRNVRQVSRLTGKQANLEIIGGNLSIDSQLLNRMVDPLMHMLRNAIDHGIEDSEQRQIKGKSEAGNISIEFEVTNDNVIVTCSDDGAGFNIKKIESTAIQNNLIDSDHKLSEQELIQLILTPGFSTSDKVDQLSGRGIGMDVVNNYIKEMKGSIQLESIEGQGSTTKLILPANLSLLNVLLIGIQNRIIGLSSIGIEQILYYEQNSHKEIDGTEYYEVDGEQCKAFFLEELLSIPRHSEKNDQKLVTPLLINNDAQKKSVIFVEKVINNYECIIKPLGQYVPKLNGIIGAAILADGNTTSILDINELIENPNTSSDSIAYIAKRKNYEIPKARSHYALVVDDSLSARQSLSEFIKDIGMEVKTAKDGFDAIQVIEAEKPSIILTDLEMPKMNGLELTSHIKSKAKLSDIPIVMITSRTTAKHKKMATDIGVQVYVTKPYSENQLLDIIREHAFSA